jgi:hypothetical protein
VVTEAELDAAIAARKAQLKARRDRDAAASGGDVPAVEAEDIDPNEALLAAREILIRPQAKRAEQKKKTHYKYLSQVEECQEFLPLIFTSGGTMSPAAARLLRGIARRGDHNDDGTRAAMPGPTWLQMVYQQLALLFVRLLPGYFGRAVIVPAIRNLPVLDEENYV